MKVTLKDGAPRSAGSVEINVSKNGNTLEIGATGVEPAPVVLEFYEGKLTLRVYGSNPGSDFVYKTTLNVSAATAPIVTFDKPAAKPTAQETVNEVFPAPAPAAEFDEAAFDAA